MVEYPKEGKFHLHHREELRCLHAYALLALHHAMMANLFEVGQAQLVSPAFEEHPRAKLQSGLSQQYHSPSVSHFWLPAHPSGTNLPSARKAFA